MVLSGIEQGADAVIARELYRRVDAALARLGLLVRVFGRVKSPDSVKWKLKCKAESYAAEEKKMQDYFGLRVAVYFPDDVPVVRGLLERLFVLRGTSIDEPDQETFGPTRYNLVFALPTELCSPVIERFERVDQAFEVQLRTILSEGWHEVEHDLRYKCQSEWDGRPDLYRAMNGVVATLENCDWSMLRIFEEQAYRHYKASNWVPMLRAKMRVRVQDRPLESALGGLLTADEALAKRVYRLDRNVFMRAWMKSGVAMPITWSNLVFLANHLVLRDSSIAALVPSVLGDVFATA